MSQVIEYSRGATSVFSCRLEHDWAEAIHTNPRRNKGLRLEELLARRRLRSKEEERLERQTAGTKRWKRKKPMW